MSSEARRLPAIPALSDHERRSIDGFLAQPPRLRDAIAPFVLAAPQRSREDSAVFGRLVAVEQVDEGWWLVRALLAIGDAGAILDQVAIASWPRETRREVTGRVLRGLRFEPIRQRALDQLRDLPKTLAVARAAFGMSEAIASSSDVTRAADDAARAPRRGRPGLPEEHFRRIALVYLELFALGYRRGILEELATREGVPKDTVRDWVHRARTLGFLSAGRQGRAGAEPGPRLMAAPQPEPEGGDDA